MKLNQNVRILSSTFCTFVFILFLFLKYICIVFTNKSLRIIPGWPGRSEKALAARHKVTTPTHHT